MVEGLGVSAIIGIVTYISVFVTMKNKTDQNQKDLESLKTQQQNDIAKAKATHDEEVKELYKRLEKHGDDIVHLNTLSRLAITAKDVDDKYVSKEYFKQFEKHMDKRFDGIESGQGKILSFIEQHIGHK